MDWIFSQIERGWTMIKDAPVLAVALLVLGFLGGIYFRNERISVMDERLKGKDDQLSDYRERLHLIPIAGTSYSRLTNNELRQKTLAVVSRTREFLLRADQQDRAMSDREFSDFVSAKSEDEKKQIWLRNAASGSQRSVQISFEYEKEFKTDSILLRDELLSRLPKGLRDDRAYSMYEHPINSIARHLAVDDLERMAKVLP